MEKIIKDYFQSWINKDSSIIEKYFSDSIVYSECYGPKYKGKEQCLKWFSDWNKKGSVISWDIKDFKSVDDTYFVQWHFKCNYENEISEFDGISVIKFEENKITLVKEFQSESKHHFPYE